LAFARELFMVVLQTLDDELLKHRAEGLVCGKTFEDDSHKDRRNPNYAKTVQEGHEREEGPL
jgi:hypothetical protein